MKVSKAAKTWINYHNTHLKKTADEIIFRTTKVRNRLMFELMARGGMRVGKVLQLRLKDIQDQKLILCEPKSGKENEVVFIPRKVADRLRDLVYSLLRSLGSNTPSLATINRFYPLLIPRCLRRGGSLHISR